MKKKLVAALCGPLIISGAIGLLGVPSAVAGSFHGVVAQGGLQASDFSRMDRGKVGTLRVRVGWRSVQPRANSPTGDWNWAALDGIIDDAAAAGVRVLPSLTGPSPRGAKTPPTNGRSRKGFARFAGALADRYGGRVGAYQIYNEQNGPAFWGARPNPRKYGKLLKAAARRITQSDRRAEIVLGGMFGTPSGPGAINSWNYLKRLYNVRRIKGAFDTIAIHPYSPNLRGIRYQVRKIRRAARAHGDSRAKLRITELGWGSARRGNLNVGRKGQARMLKKSFRLFERNRRAWNVKGVNWFSWQDDRSGTCSFCRSSGLFTQARRAKPSWTAFKRVAR
jgi:hypothetical protein